MRWSGVLAAMLATMAAAGCAGDDGIEPRGPLPAGVAFLAGPAADRQLWFLPVTGAIELETAPPVRLDGAGGTRGRVRGFTWSPTGGEVAALVGDDDVGPRELIVLADPAASDPVVAATGAGEFFAWAPGGERLLWVDLLGPLRVTAVGGLTTELSTRDVLARIGNSQFRPSWSADGRHVAYVEVIAGAPVGHVVTLAGTTVERVVTPFSVPGGWAPDGRSTLAWTLAGVSAPALELYCLATGALVRMSPDQYVHPRFAPDGRRLLLAFDDEVAVVDLDGCDLGEPVRVPLASLATRGAPRWVGDSPHAVVGEFTGPDGPRMLAIDVDPLAVRALSADVPVVEVPQFRAGSRALWGEVRDGRNILMVSDAGVAGGRELAGDVYSLDGILPSPDGRRVAYTIDDRAGHQALAIVDVDGGAPQQLLEELAIPRAWSPAGDALAFVSLSSPGLYVTHDVGGRFGPLRHVATDRTVTAAVWSP